MPALTPENALVLPAKSSYQAPTSGEELWFEQRTGLQATFGQATFDLACVDAIIAKGFGRRRCPTPGEWAAFVFAGGVTAALTDKYIVPPGLMWPPNERNHVVWQVLWDAAEENGTRLEREVLAVALRELLPRFVSGGPYFMSGYQTWFQRKWREFYPDTTSRICHVRQESIVRGRKAFRKLTPPQQASVVSIAKHIPTMLRIINPLVEAHYRW